MQSGFVDVHTAAKILGITSRHVRRLFRTGLFETAYHLGPRGFWKVSRHELIARKMAGHPNKLKDYE